MSDIQSFLDFIDIIHNMILSVKVRVQVGVGVLAFASNISNGKICNLHWTLEYSKSLSLLQKKIIMIIVKTIILVFTYALYCFTKNICILIYISGMCFPSTFTS